MPGCVLRIIGPKPQIKKFLLQSKWKPSKVYFKGDPGVPRSRGPVKISGFNLPMTSKDLGGSLENQCRATVLKINRNLANFVRLKRFRSLKGILDFGLYDKATDNKPWPSYSISPTLTSLAGRFGLGIVLSFYGPED